MWMRIVQAAILLLQVVVSIPSHAQSRQPHWPEYMTIGTGSAGGTYNAYGVGLARLLTRELDLQVLTRPTEGPAENIRLLEAGEIQLGFVTLGVAQQAWIGADWTGGRQLQAMRALFPMYDTPFHFVVRQDSGIATLAELNGKLIGIGPAAGTGGIYTPLILKTLRIEARFVTGSWSEHVKQFGAGEIDALAVAAGAPLPELLDLDRRGNLRSLGLTPAQTVALRLAIPELAPSTIGAGTYPSLRRHYPTIGLYNFAVGSRTLPDDLVYAILAAVFEHNDEMMQAHPAAAESVPSNFTKNAILPFHRGAARWFNQKATIGVIRGD